MPSHCGHKSCAARCFELMKYRADIDGLRAVAVISVVIFHAFPNALKGGFIGVDIFFVISGYLISNIILMGLKSDKFSFVDFYWRRIKRIFPTLCIVLLSCVIFGWFALLADEYAQLGKHIAGGAGFISNYLLMQEAGYFDKAAEVKPLLHLWSLGIEEQFYLVWPLCLWLAWRRGWNLFAVIVGLAITSAGLNVARVHGHITEVFFAPHTRFWELLVGALLAYFALQSNIVVAESCKSNRSQENIKSFMGLALLVTGFLLITKQKAFPGWWATLPVMGAAMVISAGSSAWVNRYILSNRVFVWFGLISFPLYLWHWPILSFARIMGNEEPSVEIRCAAVAISVLFAWVCYQFVEKPIRNGKNDKFKVIALVSCMVALGLMGFAIYKTGGHTYYNQQLIKNTEQFDYPAVVPETKDCPNSVFGTQGGHRCVVNGMHKPSNTVLVGDSHAAFLFPVFKSAFSEINLLQAAGAACPPFFNVASYQNGFPDECAISMTAALTQIEATDAIQNIIMTMRGPLQITGKGFGVAEGDFHNRRLTLTTQPDIHDFSVVFEKAMTETMTRLVNKKKRIIFLIDYPELGFDPQTCINTRPLKLFNKPLKYPCAVPLADYEQRSKAYRQIIAKALKNFPEVQVVDIPAKLCDQQWCWAEKDNRMLYSDNNHPSVLGGQYIVQDVIEKLRLLDGKK